MKTVAVFSDDVFGRENPLPAYSPSRRPLSRNWKKLQIAVLGHSVHSPRMTENVREQSSVARRSTR